MARDRDDGNVDEDGRDEEMGTSLRRSCSRERSCVEGGRWAASRDEVPRWNALAGGVVGVDVIMLSKGLRLRLVGRVGLEEDRSLRRCSRKGAVRDSPEGSWGALGAGNDRSTVSGTDCGLRSRVSAGRSCCWCCEPSGVTASSSSSSVLAPWDSSSSSARSGRGAKLSNVAGRVLVNCGRGEIKNDDESCKAMLLMLSLLKASGISKYLSATTDSGGVYVVLIFQRLEDVACNFVFRSSFSCLSFLS